MLKDKLIQIVNIQSGSKNQPSSISAEFLDKKTQITVVNNEKVYHLLQTAMYKQKRREESLNRLTQQIKY